MWPLSFHIGQSDVWWTLKSHSKSIIIFKAPVLSIKKQRKTAVDWRVCLHTHTHTHACAHAHWGSGPAQLNWRQQAGLQKVRHPITHISLLAILDFSNQSYFKNVEGKQLQLNDKFLRVVPLPLLKLGLHNCVWCVSSYWTWCSIADWACFYSNWCKSIVHKERISLVFGHV